MKVSIERYQKPKPHGATGSILFHFSMCLPLALFMYVLITMKTTGGVWPVLAILLVAIILVLLFIKGLLLVWRNSSISSKMRDKAALKAFESDSNFSLLLRPFEFDGFIPLLPHGGHTTIELSSGKLEDEELKYCDLDAPVELFDAVSNTISSITILLAVGERKEGHIGGPGLLRTNQSNWKKSVIEFMQKATHIFIMPWPTQGTLWELNEILIQNMLEKAVFIMPPNYSFKKEIRVVIRNMDNAGEMDFYYKIPLEKLEENHPNKSIEVGFLEAIEVFKKAGVTPPKYDQNGCIFYFRSGTLYTHPIPFHKFEMKTLLKNIAY